MSITNVKQLASLASTSLATYAYFTETNSDSSLLSKLQETGNKFGSGGVGMTLQQADTFVKQYTLLDYTTNSLFDDPTGFNASLFQDKETGKKVLALRGTEFDKVFQIPLDFAVADALGIAGVGFANFQAVQLYRYVKELTTAGGAAVQYSDDDVAKIAMLFFAKQIELATIALPQGTAHDIAVWALQQAGFSTLFSALANDKGVGTGAALLQVDDKVEVTGHSLGGHLALLFARMFPQYTDQVVTLNAPTFFGTGDAFLTSIGFPPSAGGNITRLEADGDGVHLIGNVDPGSVISIVQENPSGAVAAFSTNHSSINSIDGLNLMALITKLDPSLANDAVKISDYMRNASNDYKNTYEKTLDALRHMILGDSITETSVLNSDGKTDRVSLYNNMDALQKSATYQALIGKVTLVAPPTSASEARSDLGLFLSLYYLTPFALKTDGSIAADAQLTIAHPDIATQFKDDKLLTSEQLANGEANFSDMWLADRAAMLSWVNKLNTLDIDATVTNPYITNAAPQHFKDASTGKEIFINGIVEESRDFIFGSEAGADNLTGHNKSDHLYGMGGNDSINGGDGNDYIEGGAGQDTLKGEAGNDILIGGSDVDILDGGAGNDFLYGGAGADVYKLSGTYGTDTITDSDGVGIITVDNVALTGGTQVADHIYRNESQQYTYTLAGTGDTQSLFIQKDGSENKIIIRNWTTAKNLNITLQDQAIEEKPVTLGGDFERCIVANDNEWRVAA